MSNNNYNQKKVETLYKRGRTWYSVADGLGIIGRSLAVGAGAFLTLGVIAAVGADVYSFKIRREQSKLNK